MSKEHELEVLGSVYSISKSNGPREGTMVFHILSACLLCDMCPEDASLGIKVQKDNHIQVELSAENIHRQAKALCGFPCTKGPVTPIFYKYYPPETLMLWEVVGKKNTACSLLLGLCCESKTKTKKLPETWFIHLASEVEGNMLTCYSCGHKFITVLGVFSCDSRCPFHTSPLTSVPQVTDTWHI